MPQRQMKRRFYGRRTEPNTLLNRILSATILPGRTFFENSLTFFGENSSFLLHFFRIFSKKYWQFLLNFCASSLTIVHIFLAFSQKPLRVSLEFSSGNLSTRTKAHRTCGKPFIFGVNVHSLISSRRTSSSPRRARCGGMTR